MFFTKEEIRNRRDALSRIFRPFIFEFENAKVTALVVDQEVWLELPMYIQYPERPPVGGTWDDQVLIGIPNTLPRAGRGAYMVYETTKLLGSPNISDLATGLEIKAVKADIRRMRVRNAYYSARIGQFELLKQQNPNDPTYDKAMRSFERELHEFQT